jgi:glutaminase
MEQVFRRLVSELDSVSYLILDARRVIRIDDCARALLARMNAQLARQGKKLIFAHLSPATRFALLKEKEADWTDNGFFPDTDAALEWCENRLILKERPDLKQSGARVALASMDIVAGFQADEIDLLQSILKERDYAVGEVIIREGDPADSLYLLAAGLVSVRLRLGDTGRSKRLTTIAPGVAFGDLTLFDGGARSADVVAEEPSVCYVLPVAELDALAVRHPEIRSKLVLNVGRELSARLRRADAEIRSLEE